MDLSKLLNKYIKKYKILKKIKLMIESADTIAVLGHKEPDGDCVNSQLALTRALSAFGKDVYSVNIGPFDAAMSVYSGEFSSVLRDDTDLFIVVDNSSLERISSASGIDLKKTIVIDHHITNERYGVLNFVDDSFVSASEMVFLLLIYMKVDFSDKALAQMLLNGILSDNGYFRHIRDDKFFSLFVSYYLVENGADPKKSYDLMFCNNTLGNVNLLGAVLGRVARYKDKPVYYTFIGENDKNSFNGELSSNSLFKEMMSIKGGRVFVYFKDIESSKKVSVSLRSDDELDVASIAAKFGGGGHKVAAGVTIHGTLDVVKKLVLDEVDKIL